MQCTVIFDFDGVIINSHDLQRRALAHSYRLHFSDERIPYDAFFLLSGKSLDRIFSDLGLPLEMVGEYRQYSQQHVSDVKLHSGMRELLIQLRASTSRCALCTGKDRTRTLEILDLLGLTDYFDTVVCSDDVENAKPAPDSIYRIVSQLGPARLVMVGDGANDILCAKNADLYVKTIAVTWGDTPYGNLLEADADHYVHTPNELAARLKALGFMEPRCNE